MSVEKGTIKSPIYINSDHPYQVVLDIQLNGGHQSFVVIIRYELQSLFDHDMCAAFNVKSSMELIGKECNVWRPFDSRIEGIQSVETGIKIIAFSWLNAHGYNLLPPLQERKEDLKREIDHHNRLMLEEIEALINVDSAYHDWK